MANDEILVRLIDESDVDAILQMYVELYAYLNEKGFDFQLNTKNLKENLLFQLDSRFSKIYVAVRDGRTVGFIELALSKINSKLYYKGTTHIGTIVELYIKNDVRGESIGTLLMKEAMKFFEQSKVKVIQVHAMYRNTGAIEFYKKFGFQEGHITLNRVSNDSNT